MAPGPQEISGLMRLARAFALIVLIGSVNGCTKREPPAPTEISTTPTPGGPKLKIAMIPKKKGLAYFDACQKGGEEAASALGNVEFTFEGPIEDKSEEQARLLKKLGIQEYDVVAVACNDADQIAPTMRDVGQGKTKVITFDADANSATSRRAFFVNQATVDAIAHALVDEMAAQTGPNAEVAIVSSTPTASNQVAWLKSMEAYRAQKHPGLKVVVTEYGGEDQTLGIQKAQAILNGYPKVKGIWAMSSVAFPAVAQAVERAGKGGQVAVVGLSTPREMRKFVESGTVKTVILWNPVDLGYLTVYAAHALANGKLKPGDTKFDAGRLGQKEVAGDQVLLGPPMKFTKENIAQFDF